MLARKILEAVPDGDLRCHHDEGCPPAHRDHRSRIRPGRISALLPRHPAPGTDHVPELRLHPDLADRVRPKLSAFFKPLVSRAGPSEQKKRLTRLSPGQPRWARRGRGGPPSPLRFKLPRLPLGAAPTVQKLLSERC